VPKKCIGSLRSICSYFVYGTFFEVSGINCSIDNPSFVTATIYISLLSIMVTALISAAQFRFSRPCPSLLHTSSHEQRSEASQLIWFHIINTYNQRTNNAS
jgi:hypothetical protein